MADDEDSDSEVKTRRSAVTSDHTHDHDNEENVDNDDEEDMGDYDEENDDDDEEEDVGECVVMYRLPRYLRVHSSWHLTPSATQLEHHRHRHVLGLFKNDLISEGGWGQTKDDQR